MEPRHYNWDIVLLTPDFAQIPKELKGVAELAKQHKGKDGIFFSNRKPRILEHDPTRTVTKPSKDDVVYNLKVPLDVHLLYASTVTGQITKSGLRKNIFLNPNESTTSAIAAKNFGLRKMFFPRDRKSTRLNSSHTYQSRMPSSA